MSIDYLQQLPRNSLIWLLVAMFAGVAPHVLRLPLWLTLVCLLCGFWRVQVYYSRWHLPGKWLRALLVFSGMAAVLAQYGTLLGPDAGSALLILGFCYKLLESKSRRDAFVVAVLGFFVVATAFFFSQSIFSAVYLILVCFLIIGAMIGLNQTPLQAHPGRTAKTAFTLLLHSLPIMLVLFIFVPRVAPLWSLDLSASRAKTGLSDQITPGDIAQLSRSPELAFRVEFEGPVPAPQQRYWRALVMDHYDGASWRRAAVNARGQASADDLVHYGELRGQEAEIVDYLGDPYRYRVIMEPTDQRWLFALAAARDESAEIGYSRDHRLLSKNTISQPKSYRVESFLDYRLDPDLPDWLRQQNLQLPPGDPKTRELAARLQQQADSPMAIVDAALGFFREQPFSYTLQPATLSGDRVDAFLFNSREGFCSHYAGAFVYLMRAAGVPARIVAGYQGGEVNPMGGYLLVHQFDAHAWAEVWLEGQGWVRVDPTAVISPSRVDQGIEQAFSGADGFLADSPFSPLRYRDISWLQHVRLGWDYLNYAWHRAVLGYDSDTQAGLLSGLLGKVNFQKLALSLVVIIAVMLTLLALLLFWRKGLAGKQAHRSPELRVYQRFCKKMADRGEPRRPGEAPEDYLLRLQQRWPEQGPIFAAITRAFSHHEYAPTGEQRDGSAHLRQLLQKL